MKTFRTFGLALVAMVFGIAFSACDGDADIETHDPALVGTWEYHESGSDWSLDEKLTFKASGKWEVEDKYWEDGETEKGKLWGTWETEAGYLTIVCTGCSGDVDEDEIGDSSYGRYTVTDTTLTFEGATYTKKK